MLALRLPENGLHHDLEHFGVHNVRWVLSGTEEKFEQLGRFALVVVWRDLVEPQAHFLTITFCVLGGLQVCFGILAKLLHHFVLFLAPGSATFTGSAVEVTTTSVVSTVSTAATIVSTVLIIVVSSAGVVLATASRSLIPIVASIIVVVVVIIVSHILVALAHALAANFKFSPFFLDSVFSAN